MDLPLKPIFLFADSQLLFWKTDEALFLNSIRNFIDQDNPKAAYLGASNGDNPDYYSIFEAAMDGIGIHDCRMVLSSFSTDDQAFISEADLILLAGGDVEAGWRVFERTGLKDVITRRYFEGALLMGISAGAVQLGLGGWPDEPLTADDLFDTFKLIPFVVGVHEENEDWQSVKRMVQLMGEMVRGIGIPSGGGMIYYADHSVEPIRFPLYEFSIKGEQINQSLLFPSEQSAEGPKDNEMV